MLGFFCANRTWFIAVAVVLLGLSFYLNIVRRRTRLNVAVFVAGALFVAAMTAFNLTR